MNNRQIFLTNQEAERIQERLGRGNLQGTERTTRAVAKQMLLKGKYFWDGRLLEPVVKHLGLGVYEVSVKEA